jgi:CubicO group peptidase (beta-lactamase class C family)
MVRNHNPTGMTPRGLGWNVGLSAGSKGCSEKTFGHTGSTGTIAWADPAHPERGVISLRTLQADEYFLRQA